MKAALPHGGVTPCKNPYTQYSKKVLLSSESWCSLSRVIQDSHFAGLPITIVPCWEMLWFLNHVIVGGGLHQVVDMDQMAH